MVMKDFGKGFELVKAIVIDGIEFVNSGYIGGIDAVRKRIKDYI